LNEKYTNLKLFIIHTKDLEIKKSIPFSTSNK
jgi:hypothetical protein